MTWSYYLSWAEQSLCPRHPSHHTGLSGPPTDSQRTLHARHLAPASAPSLPCSPDLISQGTSEVFKTSGEFLSVHGRMERNKNVYNAHLFTIMHSWTRGCLLRNALLGEHHTVHSHTNLDGLACDIPRIHGVAYGSEATNSYSMLLH